MGLAAQLVSATAGPELADVWQGGGHGYESATHSRA
jgi:hypothetical protein